MRYEAGLSASRSNEEHFEREDKRAEWQVHRDEFNKYAKYLYLARSENTK